MAKRTDFDRILSHFSIDSNISEYGDGHINDTYLTGANNYILQRINTSIFKEPDLLMKNIENVTAFLKKKIIAAGGNPRRETLTVIKTKDGNSCYRDKEGNAYRVYEFVNGSRAISVMSDASDMYKVGRGFGKFQYMLRDYPAETLFETIKDFHNTPFRIENLRRAICEDRFGRASAIQKEIEFALARAEFGSVITDGLRDGSIPMRVTHNDTKINNILFDAYSGDALCVIDLDTVMPGSALYDIGDSFRTGAADAAEDETDLSLVTFNIDAFTYFVKGYFEEMRGALTEREIELIPFSAKLMTYECGIRFLADYLDGDVYFKVHREGHNLDRARNQFRLVEDIEKKEAELRKIVEELK